MNFGNRRAIVALSLVVLVGTGAVVWAGWRWAGRTTNTNLSVTSHQEYANLYEAMWRQDDGSGAELFTATLFMPKLKNLLYEDTARTATDEQIYQKLRALPERGLTVVLTLDGPREGAVMSLSESAIRDALELRSADQSFGVASLEPLIAPAAVSTNGNPMARRMWLAEFRSDQDWDWSTLRDLTLRIKNIGGVKERAMTWARPAAVP